MCETGIYQTIGTVRYFIPHPLPPATPPLELSPEIVSLYGQATAALGILNDMGQRFSQIKIISLKLM